MEPWHVVLSSLGSAVAGPFIWAYLKERLGFKQTARRDDVTYVHDAYRETYERVLAELKELKTAYTQLVAENMRLNARVVQLQVRYEPGETE